MVLNMTQSNEITFRAALPNVRSAERRKTRGDSIKEHTRTANYNRNFRTKMALIAWRLADLSVGSKGPSLLADEGLGWAS
jgi:hypothetical protein